MNYKIKKIYCLLCDDFKHLEEVDWKEYIDHGKSHHNVKIKDISKIKLEGNFQSFLFKSDDGSPYALVGIG